MINTSQLHYLLTLWIYLVDCLLLAECKLKARVHLRVLKHFTWCELCWLRCISLSGISYLIRVVPLCCIIFCVNVYGIINILKVVFAFYQQVEDVFHHTRCYWIVFPISGFRETKYRTVLCDRCIQFANE